MSIVKIKERRNLSFYLFCFVPTVRFVSIFHCFYLKDQNFMDVFISVNKPLIFNRQPKMLRRERKKDFFGEGENMDFFLPF